LYSFECSEIRNLAVIVRKEIILIQQINPTVQTERYILPNTQNNPERSPAIQSSFSSTREGKEARPDHQEQHRRNVKREKKIWNGR